MSWATLFCVKEQLLCFILKKNCPSNRDTKTLSVFILSWCLNIGLEYFFVLLSPLLVIQQSPLESDTAWMERKERENVERKGRENVERRFSVKDYSSLCTKLCSHSWDIILRSIFPESEDWIELQVLLPRWKPPRVKLLKKKKEKKGAFVLLCPVQEK